LNTTSTPNSTESIQKPDKRDSQGSRYLLGFGLVMLAGLTLLAYIGSPPQSEAVGEPLPQIDLQPLVYIDQPLTRDQLLGKVTLLHIWGPWCHYCRLEFPEFVQLADEFASDQRVQIASVSCSPGPEYDLDQLRADTSQFLEEHDVQLPTYADPAAMTRGKLSLLLPDGSLSYPTSVLVDREGKIVRVLEGYLEGEMLGLRSDITELLLQAN
jgi:cytochrome c biogenesis protein CcmG, thiol:disulfide interchange protein DsbE